MTTYASRLWHRCEALALSGPMPRAPRILGAGAGCRKPRPQCGTVFVGTSAVVGDYASGATQLPTGGLARGAGGLGLESFLKPIQTVRATDLTAARAIALPLARVEGLPLHVAALEAR